MLNKLAPQCFLVFTMIAGTNAHAQSPVLDLPESRCNLREAVAALHFQSVERRAAIAEQMLPVVDNLKAVTEKVKDNNRPVGDQLSTADVDKFSRYSQQIQTMQLSSLIESRRLWDLSAIETMAMLADQEYRWSKTPKENTDDAIYHASYQVIKLISSKLEVTEPKTKQCTLEYALHKLAQEPISKLEPLLPQVPAASSYYKSLTTKYKTDPIDRKKLTTAERVKYDEYENNVFSIFRKNYSYVKDIQSIKVMANALELMYQANMQDIALSGGSIDAIGKTIQRNIQKNAYDEPTQLALGMWTKINEKIPSEDVQNWQKNTTR